MKVELAKIPSNADLTHAYVSFQSPNPLPATELALFSQWARFDPRLAEIWVQHITEHWRAISPMELRNELIKQPWPSAGGAMLEFVARARHHDREHRRLFKHWKDFVTDGFERSPWQQFFIGQRRIAGELMIDDARFSLREFRTWGYLSREVLFNKQVLPFGLSGPTHRIEPAIRMEILKSLMEKHARITTQLYWEALGQCVSRRQAERDLLSNSSLQPLGQTRARVFIARRRS